MSSKRAVSSLLFLLGVTLAMAEPPAACADFFKHVCTKEGAKDGRDAWLAEVLQQKDAATDKIMKATAAARAALGISDASHPIEKELVMADGEMSVADIEAHLKTIAPDFAALTPFYEPLFTFFTVYARTYETESDEAGARAIRALEYMDRFKNDEDAESFVARRRSVAVSMHRARSYGKMNPSVFYATLLKRTHVRHWRLAQNASGISFKAVKDLVGQVPKVIEEELKSTAAGKAREELLGLSYVDVLREEWRKMKAPEDDNVEEALNDYRTAYAAGEKLWKPFGASTAAILGHLSALHAINKKYPGDILDLITNDVDFNAVRFLKPIQKEDRLVLPEAFLVESVYRTSDKNMGLLAFRVAKVMLERAFTAGSKVAEHMQDEIKNCTTGEFRETYEQLYKRERKLTEKEPEQDIYFMEAVQAALRTINPDFKTSYDAEKVADFYTRLAEEYCHDAENGAYLVNGAARFFKPFSTAFACAAEDPLSFKDNNCLPLGSSNVHRRSSVDL